MQEMMHGLRSLGLGFSEGDIAALAAAADADSDGRVDYAEFVSYFKPARQSNGVAPSSNDSPQRRPQDGQGYRPQLAAPPPRPVAVLGYDTTGDGRPDAFDTNQDGRVDTATTARRAAAVRLRAAILAPPYSLHTVY